MYDLWFSLGVAVMDPTLVTDIDAAGPVFTRVTRVITEKPSGWTFTNATTAGLLQAGPTVAVRKAISAHLQKNPAAPPVSIYTAGKWSQLLTVSGTFRQYLSTANAAYVAALGGAAPNFSPCFPAALGLCLLDTTFSGRFVKNPPNLADPDFVQALDEFDLNSNPNSPEFRTISAFARGMAIAQNQLLVTSPEAEWADLCPDQRDYWDPQNDRAVI
jgi:hypothetical protein